LLGLGKRLPRARSSFAVVGLFRPRIVDFVDAPAATSGRSPPSPAITVATVDGDPLARRALREQLAPESDIDLVGEAPDASTGVDLVKRQQPDLVLIAISRRDRHGSAAIGEMVRASPGTRIIVLALELDEDAQMRFLRAGAAGWLLKSIDLEVLPRVLRGVRAGEAAVPRAFCKRIVEVARVAEKADGTRLRPIRSSLTRREWEVIDLLAEGATTAGIAHTLELSPATVRTHVKHILRKLGVHSREDAISHVERLLRVRQPPID
jgi:two-component system, NarL family, response regulator LiaR